ncbi:uncharacterized protein V6R79_023130 [Siganus canaliculatus]
MSRVAVVTGSNKGIGLAIVRALCKQFQGDVYLTARDVGRGEEAVKSLNSEGLKPLFYQLDIDDLSSITTAATFFKEKYGGVDVLVNNAAIAFKMADPAPFATQAEVTLRTNFFATRDMLINFMPIIKAGGRVVNVSSMSGASALKKCSSALQERFRSEDITEEELVGLMQRFVDEAKKGQHKEGGWPDTAYGTSKTGLTTLSMILARRLSKDRPNDGVLLNACCPGWVRTDMAGPTATKSPDEGMAPKVAVVTGSNKGIGLSIVRALCSNFQGDVYVTSRDVGRGEVAVTSLAGEGRKAFFHQLDIEDQSSITTAAAFFKDKYGGVDVLVNNAAIAFKAADPTPFSAQAETTLKINFFATRDMLTHFMPLIKPGGRVVNVSSFVGANTLKKCSPELQERFRSEDITEEELVSLMQQFVDLAKKGEHQKGGWPDTAYGTSKTGLTTLSMILARRLSKERPNDGILLNACCPGWVRTDMSSQSGPKSPDEGAITPVYLALLPPGATEPHGKFVSDKEVQPW